MSKQKTFWPYGIALSILACVALCVGTIWVSLDYPVEMDHFYLERYQKVDGNINEIIAAQKAFDAKYDVVLENKNFSIKDDKNLKILLISKQNSPLPELKTQLLLTRPDSNANNIELNASVSENALITSDFTLAKEGRWQLMLKIDDGSDVGFYKLEFFAK